MNRQRRPCSLVLVGAVAIALGGLTVSGEAQILLDADTPATGSQLLITPLVTPYGNITFTGEIRDKDSDPEFDAAGASGDVFDIDGTRTAQLSFAFDVTSITFIYGGNSGEIRAEARNGGGGIVDSFYQASTYGGQPAGPTTLQGTGIRSLWWQDTQGSFCAIDNVSVMPGGVACTVTGPAAVATGDIDILLDSVSTNSPTVDATFEFSLDNGVTYSPCTAAGASAIPNPAVGIPTGPATFTWDSVADGVGTQAVATGVLVQVTVDDGVPPTATCETAPFDVDNRPPAPTCTLTGPAGVGQGNVDLTLDSASANAPAVDVTFEYSLDGGVTYSTCTAAASSPIPNPAVGVPTGTETFVWASRTDGVGLAALVPGVLVQALLDDGVSPITGVCATAPFDVDNTSLCGGICGDCDLGGTGPNIVDALIAAQIGALLLTPTLEQTGCCDVNSSGGVDVLDALVMAQSAAALPVTLVCP